MRGRHRRAGRSCLAVLLAGIYGHAAHADDRPGLVLRLSVELAQSAAQSPPAAPQQPPAQAPQGLAMLVGTRRAADAGTARSRPEFLLLELVVNGRKQDGVARAEVTPAGELLLALDAWRDARLREGLPARQLSDGTPAFALDALHGASYRLQRASLQVEITAAAEAFESTVLDRAQQVPAAARPQPGAILNYDVTASSTGEHAMLLEGVAFGGGAGTLSSSGLASSAAGGGFHRVESAWRYDMPGAMQSVVLGDTVASGGAWSRPVRFGGLHFGRNFGLRPGFVTYPQVNVAGEAALPSAVDVLVNNSSRLAEHVQPGPFSITNVPVVTGAGQVSVVVRDLLGREQVLTQDYYSSTSILARGLTDYSVEAGWLRTDSGQDARYGDAFGAATLRRGLSDAVTAEGRVELQAARRAAGGEIAAVLAKQAVGRASLAVSSHERPEGKESGRQLQLGLERSTPAGSMFASYQGADRGFAPLGEADDAASRGRRVHSQLQLGGSLPVMTSSSLGASLIQQRRWDGDDFRLAALTLSMGVPRGGLLTVSASRRLSAQGGWDAMVSLGFPLDGGNFVEAHATRSAAGGNSAGVSVNHAAPVGPGWGWRVEGSSVPGQQAHALASYDTRSAELGVEATSSSGATAVRGSLRGAVGMLDAIPFTARPVADDSFALVDANGLADIPIYVGYQEVARTDAQGRAFVPRLLPWQRNALQIQPQDLPMDVEADPAQLVQELVPQARAGNVVHFPLHRVRQALLVLRTPGGELLPSGAHVRAAGHDYLAGRRGEVWLADLPAGSVRVEWSEGQCSWEMDEHATLRAGERLELRCGA